MTTFTAVKATPAKFWLALSDFSLTKPIQGEASALMTYARQLFYGEVEVPAADVKAFVSLLSSLPGWKAKPVEVDA